MGLFGFTERGWEPSPQAEVSVIAEVFTVVLVAVSVLSSRSKTTVALDVSLRPARGWWVIACASRRSTGCRVRGCRGLHRKPITPPLRPAAPATEGGWPVCRFSQLSDAAPRPHVKC